jgi:hypothetical protein
MLQPRQASLWQQFEAVLEHTADCAVIKERRMNGMSRPRELGRRLYGPPFPTVTFSLAFVCTSIL